MNEIEKISSYPELERPVFQDNIPAHLLVGIDDRSRYSIQQLSLISQQNEWLIKAATDTNEQVRNTNGRVKLIEVWRTKLEDKQIESKLSVLDKLFGFWAVTTGLIFGAATIAAGVIAALKALGVIHS